MFRLADWIDRQRDLLADAESTDTGKTLRQARTVDIPRAIVNLRFFAAMAQTWNSESYGAPNEVHYTLRQPLGVVGCVSPWNLPLYLLTWKIAPALAAGNCVIGKPSEVTPLTAYLLSRGVEECGWPAGVLNIVHGRGASTGEALIAHPGIRAVSFTGGTTTGARIASLARAGDVLVSATVRDLVAGSEIGFEDRGQHVLKGLPEERRVYAVTSV